MIWGTSSTRSAKVIATRLLMKPRSPIRKNATSLRRSSSRVPRLTLPKKERRRRTRPHPPWRRRVQEFVAQGGTLYASDLRFDTLQRAFPEFIDEKKLGQGVDKNVRATVQDADLRGLVGSEVPLHFDRSPWRSAAFKGEGVTVYLKGSFKTNAGVTDEAPLLVKFPHGKGAVLFTSFHNTTQNSPIESKVLKYVVLSTVTARVEAQIVRGGFSPTTKSLLTVAPGDSSVKRTFEHAKTGSLRFSLGFERQGAKLRLEVVSPTGEQRVERGDSTITIDVPDAAAGPWKYTAVAEDVPYKDFPFLLSVAEPEVKTKLDGGSQPPLPGTGVEFRVVAVEKSSGSKSGPRRIGVTKPKYDDMGKLLAKLGEGYKYEVVQEDSLLTPRSLDEFDIVFLTCSTLPGAWFEKTISVGARIGTMTGVIRPEITKKLADTLRPYVENGGTLYASDFRRGVVYYAFDDRGAESSTKLCRFARTGRGRTEMDQAQGTDIHRGVDRRDSSECWFEPARAGQIE